MCGVKWGAMKQKISEEIGDEVDVVFIEYDNEATVKIQARDSTGREVDGFGVSRDDR